MRERHGNSSHNEPRLLTTNHKRIMKYITRIVRRFTRANTEPPLPAASIAAAESPSDTNALPPCVAIYKIHTCKPEHGHMIMFGVPGRGKNFRLRREHWVEARAYQAAWEICTEIGWPERFESESQMLHFVNAAREFARSRHYAVIH